jgi:hypothetical protein
LAFTVTAAAPASIAANLFVIVTVMLEVTVMLNWPLVTIIAGDSASVTCTWKVKGVDCVWEGVPLITPPGLKVTPLGTEPETPIHAYGGNPPLA